MSYLSIIIPAYNEENRLPATLDSVYNFFVAINLDFEIIVVNDGSTDNTNNVINQYACSRPQIKTIINQTNRGKGFAIRTGVLAANSELILIDDADGSSPIEEFDRLHNAIKNGADIAIGSRAKPDLSRTVNALAYRTYIGNTFNRIVQSLLLPGLYDTQCGFKLFKKEIAHNIFSLATIDGYAFDVEILYIAKLKKYRIDEIAINWHNVKGSKVNVLVDSIKMLAEVLRISCNAKHGKYGNLENKSTEIREDLKPLQCLKLLSKIIQKKNNTFYQT